MRPLQLLEGKTTTIVVKNNSATHHGPFAHITPKTNEYTGVILRRHIWDKDWKNFRIQIPGEKDARIIHTNNLLKVNGADFVQPGSGGVRTFEITGSKGAKYTVTDERGHWKCTCVAGSYGKMCRHILEAKEKT